MADDLLRKFTLTFVEKSKFGSLQSYKYAVDNSTYATTSEHAPNCAYGNDAPSGSFNITMLKNAPIHMSKPFFMDADPSYRANIDGLETPNRSKHAMEFYIEPRLGIPLKEMKRAQINFHVQRLEHWPMTKGLREGGFYSPLAWTDEDVELPADLQNEISAVIHGSDALSATVRYGGLVVGVILILWCTYLIINKHVAINVKWKYAQEGVDGRGDRAPLRENAPLLLQ